MPTLPLFQNRLRRLLQGMLAALLLLAVGMALSGPRVVRADPGVDLQPVVAITPAGGFVVGGTGSTTVVVSNIGDTATTQLIRLDVVLATGLAASGTFSSTPGNLFTCNAPTATTVRCTATGSIPALGSETVTINLNVPGPASFNTQSTALVDTADEPAANTANNVGTFTFNIAGPTATPSPTFTLTPPPTLLPSLTPLPTITPTFTPTFIPPPATRTPLPRPANAGQSFPIPPTGVSAVIVTEGTNFRLVPAIGAEVVGTLNAGLRIDNLEARSPDGEWVRATLGGQQGWIGVPTFTVLSGNIADLPVADPRTIPYGGFENPRAGLTSVTGPYSVRLADSNQRLRAGPSTGYPILANPPRYSVMPLLGVTADKGWVQVNFEGTLGWMKWIEGIELITPNATVNPLDAVPVDGVIADALPFSDNTFDSYVDTLKLMLDRVNIAQGSLDQVRAIWTDVALGGTVTCGNYPARPSDFNIPQSLLAAFYGTLDPLQRDFNQAMAYIRQSIDILYEACGVIQPQPGSVGVGTASTALEAANAAASLLDSLRERLIQLIPSEQIPTEDQCLFTFNNQNQVIPRLVPGRVSFTLLDRNERVKGFCFDATQGLRFRIEALRVSGQANPQIAVSGFAQPTDFIAVGRLPDDESYVSIFPILIPQTGQYLVLISDVDNITPDAELAVLLTDITTLSGVPAPNLGLDANGNVITNPVLAPIVPTAAPTPSG
jgi:hypothetical protein